jgi:hypothetical protein
MNNNKLAAQLKEGGYDGLFLSGSRDFADSIWQLEKNHRALLEIVAGARYDDYVRLLASEILFLKKKNFPPADMQDTLAYIYSNALFITATPSSNSGLYGNLWGYMYNGTQYGNANHDVLGSHLIQIGKKAVPYLSKLLDDTGLIFYEGSQEATKGNSYKYRVKDAAAYYIGEILGIPVQFHENFIDRDNEIDMLLKKIK